MTLHLVGCSHRSSSVDIREQLAFTPAQAVEALRQLRSNYPTAETVLLSTCNRVELYMASDGSADLPDHSAMIQFLAAFHGLDERDIAGHLFLHSDIDAVKHLFMVAASLDSMVLGEAQILSQVKQAFATAQEQQTTGPVTHLAFETANRVAKRVASETEINRRRVSIPSVAVADFARQFFETFHDKNVLLLGAGEMGEETLRYLWEEGARRIVILNRHLERAEDLAKRLGGTADAWDHLQDRLGWADLVVSTTGAHEPIVTAQTFHAVQQRRTERTLIVLDLAVPRDFDPAVGSFSNVYLFCIDDLQRTCQRNRAAREKEWPAALQIVAEETDRFVADAIHRGTGPTIQRLKQQADMLKSDELRRLLNKLGEIDGRTKEEIERSFDRLVNKLLHPPLETLRDEASRGSPHRMLDALRHLFKIND